MYVDGENLSNTKFHRDYFSIFIIFKLNYALSIRRNMNVCVGCLCDRNMCEDKQTTLNCLPDFYINYYDYIPHSLCFNTNDNIIQCKDDNCT